MKTQVLTFLSLAAFALPLKAETLICSSQNKSALFRIQYDSTDLGTLQIVSAQAKVALMKKSDTRHRKYYGKGRPPRVQAIIPYHGAVEVRARGGIMGKGGSLLFPVESMTSPARHSMHVTYLQPRTNEPSLKIDLLCRKFD